MIAFQRALPRPTRPWLLASIQLLVPAAAPGRTLLSFDFNGPNPWPGAATDVTPDTPVDVAPSVETAAVGTIDVVNSTEPSGAFRLAAEVGDVGGAWGAVFGSGPLAVTNVETNLGKLTLAFSLSASAARPIVVRAESFDASKRRTGGLEMSVYPAAPDVHQRYAIDLSSMKPAGPGAFSPTDPHVQFTFVIEGPAWPGQATHEVRVDNVHYASPAWYVSPTGSDGNDGRSEATPLADAQKALDRAEPGDIVLLMDGEHRRAPTSSIHDGVAAFRRAGTPAAWITLKNYPGHRPVLKSDGWNTIKIGRGTKVEPCKEPALAYLEVRGLHIRGNADVARQQFPDEIGKVSPNTNGNGLSVDGRHEANAPHHVRFADNLVELCSGGGIGSMYGDWITIENNVARDNCWFMIYAGSGISVLGTANFDASDNVYKSLVRDNRVSGNRCYMPWAQVKKMSDGNGIIIDSNHVPATGASYRGRTLVQNNVSFNNGGSGIHSFKSHRVDIVNKTAYLNAATPELRWGQIFLQRTDDARVINNVMVARDGQPVNTVGKDISDKGNTNVVRANNMYFGGGVPPIMGADDVIADPQFVNPSTDTAAADFRVRPGSPAVDTGRGEPFVPSRDADGTPRPQGGGYDRGAYER